MDTRNLIQAIFASLLVFFLVSFLFGRFGRTGSGGATESVPGVESPFAPGEAAASAPATQAAPVFQVAGGDDTAPVVLRNDSLELDVHPRGAAIDTIRLVSKDKRGRFAFRKSVDSDEAYAVVSPVEAMEGTARSFQTHRLWVQVDGFNVGVRLDALAWRRAGSDERSVVFEATVRDGDGADALIVRKSYALDESKPTCRLDVSVESLMDRPIGVALEQDGATGIPRENIQFNMRWVAAAKRAAPGDDLSIAAFEGSRLLKPGKHYLVRPQEKTRLAWTALANKYFGVYLRPVSIDEQTGHDMIMEATAFAPGRDRQTSARGDLTARLITRPQSLEARGSTTMTFEVYAGPKDRDIVRRIDPAYADATQVGYSALYYADQHCFCQFEWLTQFMTTFLELLHRIVPNYGLAIIALVIVVRTLLHPLTVFQQKSMFRAQEGMSKIQPRIAELKKKYPDDKVKQNQEMMKIYAEEGVNPAAPLLGILPMFIQMPILIALWGGINRDIHLRHAAFDGWWIRDLGSPDAFYTFAGSGMTIPILGWLIPFMFANIQTINLLPVAMGVSMWLQQKYMPKPHLQAKLDAARKARDEGREPDAAGPGGMTIEDQIRQQQIMAYMMSVLFPLMFYYMPAGLNLYWLATNVFGIGESILVRRQLDAERVRREAGLIESKPRKKGIISRWLEKMAAGAEELQRMADEASKTGGGNQAPKVPKLGGKSEKKRKATRF